MKLLRCFLFSGAAFGAQPALAQAEIAPTAARAIVADGDEQDALSNKDTTSHPESAAALGRLPEVVVTARRVEENIQLTPLAITVVSNTDLTAAHVTNFSELQSSAPGLTISNGVGQPGSATLYQRGQGSSDALIAVDKAIGTYINGVYSARSSGGAFDLVDIARIEVLRGPQGTLFGRNTTGGAINVVPNEPTFMSQAAGRVEFGNYGHLLTEVMANLPVLAEQIAVRVVYRHDAHDGYGRNDLLNRDVGSDNRDFVRISAKLAPNDLPLSVLLAADYNQITNDGQMTGLKSFTSTRANQSLIAACAGAFGPTLSALCPFGQRNDSYANYTYERGKRGFYDFSLNVPSYGRIKSYGVSSVVELALSDQTSIKSITAWRGVDVAALTDFDGTPYAVAGGVRPVDGNFTNEDQFSEELQLHGKTLSDRLEYIGGLFYFVENGRDRSGSSNVYPLSQLVGLIDGEVRNRSLGVFSQATLSLPNAIRLTAGIRYTSDNRKMIIRNRDLNLSTGAQTPAYVPTDGDASDPFRASFSKGYQYWSYTLSADWEARPGLLMYARTSRASKSGGFNTRAVVGGLPPVAFGPETVTDYEIGGKADFFQNRLRINIAAYYSRLKDAQRNLIGIAPGNRLVSGASNAASARIKGGEVEVSVLPLPGLSLSGSASLTEPKYVRFLNPINGADLSQTPFIYSPKWTYSLSASFRRAISTSATVVADLRYSYRTKAFAVTLNDPLRTEGQNDALQQTAKIPGYGLLNGRLGMNFDRRNIELAIYGTNLLAKRYYVFLLPLEGTDLGVTSYSPGAPRTFGVAATYRY